MKSLRALLILLGAVAVFGIALLLAGRREAASSGEPGTAPSESEPAPAPAPREREHPAEGPAADTLTQRRAVEGQEQRTVVLRGRVVERVTREPVAGARVVRSDDLAGPAWAIGVFEGLIDGLSEAAQGEGASKKRPGLLATTGEDGTFEILEGAGLESETKLAIEAQWHFLPSPVSAKPAPGAEVILEAARGGRLAGRVLDEEGRPASAATVSVLSSITFLSALGEDARPPVRRRASTGEDGSFEFGGLPPGSGYKLSAQGEGMTPVDREGIRIAEGRETRVELRARPGGLVAGVVRDEAGKPVAGATARAVRGAILPGLPSGPPAASATSGEDGRFLLAHVPAGPVFVTASSPGRVPKVPEETEPLDVREGETAGPIEIVLRPAAVLAGRVVDPDGRPSPEAEVEVYGGPDPGAFLPGDWMAVVRPKKARTGSDGGFRFEGLAAMGPFALTARKKPFAPGRASGVPAGKTDLLIALEPSSGIAGRVLDSLREAAVTRFSVSARPAGIEEEGTAETVVTSTDGSGPAGGSVQVRFDEDDIEFAERFEDEAGKFLLEGLSAGTYTLAVEAEGFVREEVPGIEVVRGEVKRGVIVAMRPAASIAGRVLDPGGAPKAGAKVVARPSGKKEEGLDLGELLGAGDGGERSGPDGAFVLKDLEPGKYDVLASAEGFARGKAEGIEVGAGEAREGVEARLRLGGSIHGTVADRHGRPVPSRRIAALSMAAGAAGRAQSEDDGEYEIVGLERGSYLVFLEKEGESGIPFLGAGMQIQSASVRDGERTRLDILDESAAGCRVRGTVSRKGRPLANAFVLATRQEGGFLPGIPSSLQSARAGPDGRYEFQSLAPGEYSFAFGMHVLAGEPAKVEIEVPDRDEFVLDLEVPESSLAGRVTDAATGRPVGGAEVRLLTAKDAQRERLGEFSKGSEERTGADGAFSFSGVAPGSYTLLASKGDLDDSYSPARIENLQVETGRPVEDLVVALERGGAIRIAFTGPEGAAVEHAFAEVERDGVPVRTRDFAESGGVAVEIGGLEAGTYAVILHVAGLASARVEGIPVERGRLAERSVVLEKGTALSVVLLDRRGERAAGATIEVLDARGRRVSASSGVAKVAHAIMGMVVGEEASGSSEFVGRFAAGTYRIRALRGAKEVASTTVDLAGEEAREAVLRQD